MYQSHNIRKYNTYLIKNQIENSAFFKSKTLNQKIKYLYKYILYKYYIDPDNGDFWDMGRGSNDLQNLLNQFTNEDWFELKCDILNWNRDEREILIESIAFGFDGMFTPSLEEEMIPNAGNFLIDMFIIWDDIDNRIDILENAFFINMSKSKRKKDLIFIKDWMLKNGYDSEIWKSRIELISDAIEYSNM